MIPLCQDEDIAVLPWSPLARGFLVGNRSLVGGGITLRAKTDETAHCTYGARQDFEIVKRVANIAQARNLSEAQISLAWLLNKPGVTSPIIGATEIGHIDEAIAAAEVELSSEELRLIEEPYRPRNIVGHC